MIGALPAQPTNATNTTARPIDRMSWTLPRPGRSQSGSQCHKSLRPAALTLVLMQRKVLLYARREE